MRLREITTPYSSTDLIHLQWLYRRAKLAYYAFEKERYRQRLRDYNALLHDRSRRGPLPPRPEEPRPPRFDWA